VDCEEPVFYEAQCPSCGETVTFDEGVLSQGSIQCPACGESLEFELDEDEDEEE
jgi:transcription initiation factor IIE alpha subunit